MKYYEKPISTPKRDQSTIRVGQPKGPHNSVQVQQRPLQQVGRPQTTRGTEEGQQDNDKEHLEALRGQAGVILQLVHHRLDNRQLQSLYSGLGRTGVDRFLRDQDGSVYGRVYSEFYDERIIGSLTLTAGGDPLQPVTPDER